MDEFDPQGVALVVGGSGGVGRAIAERLARGGADVALTFRQHPERAEAAVAAIAALGRRASSHTLDVSDAPAVDALFDELQRTHGRVHTVVHAAGSAIAQPFVAEVAPDTFRAVLDADVAGFFHIVRAALPQLRRGGGSIVYLSSAGLRRHPPGDILSVAPKAAAEALVRGVAREEGRFGVRANSVALGVIDAGMFPRLVASGALDAEWLAAARKNTPLRDFGRADDVAEAVAFLASRRARYVTGQQLLVDGGYSI